MKAFTSSQMILLYKFTRSTMLAGGVILLAYGTWWLSIPLIYHTSNPLYLFGIFPIYVGSMVILIALAMKEDWFTNARRYW